MIIYIVRVRNNYSESEYNDSMWINRANAEKQLETLSEPDPTDLPDEWDCWISETETRD